MLLSMAYIPYDPSELSKIWNSVFTSIGSSANLGFLIFQVFCGIVIFRTVMRMFF